MSKNKHISSSPELEDMVEKLDIMALAEHRMRAQSLGDDATAAAVGVAMTIVQANPGDGHGALAEWLNVAS